MKITILIITVLLMFGCKQPSDDKHIDLTKNKFNVSIKNNMLSFKSIEDYTQIANDSIGNNKKELVEFLKKSSFNSLNKNKKESLYEKIDDDFLSSIITPKGFIEIGNHIYQINPRDEKVYVIPNNKPELINLISNKKFDNKLIKKYPIGENVIEMVKNNGQTNAKLFCRESGCGEASQSGHLNLKDPKNGENCNWMDSSVSYNRYGIYFTLKAKCINKCPSRIMYYHKDPVKFKVKCGYSYGPVSQWNISSGGVGSSSWTWNNNFYSGIQPLNGFILRVVFMAKDASWIGNPDNPSVDLIIRKNM